MTEIVYILTNEAMPGLVKIGKTHGDLAGRMRSLYTSGVPLSFDLFYACAVEDCALTEMRLHEAFGDHRISKSREFFMIAPERVRAALLLAEKREVNVGDEAYESVEAKAEVESVKRRSRFRFSMIDLKPGTELHLAKDPSIKCTTVDEINQVLFNDETTSLSDAALQAIKSLGFDWPTVSGPWEWAYDGKRLDDIRRKIQEGGD